MYEIRHYLTTGQKDVFMEWRRQIRDPKARVAVDRRINRIELNRFYRWCTHRLHWISNGSAGEDARTTAGLESGATKSGDN